MRYYSLDGERILFAVTARRPEPRVRSPLASLGRRALMCDNNQQAPWTPYRSSAH
jgi:hypothetical protein